MSLGIGQQMPLREQLTDHRQPSPRVEFGPDAKGLELVVAKAPDAFGRVADQHIGQMMRAKGVTFPVELKQGVGGSLLCYVAAPDGVSIELMQC